jgi:hypothetical protein
LDLCLSSAPFEITLEAVSIAHKSVLDLDKNPLLLFTDNKIGSNISSETSSTMSNSSSMDESSFLNDPQSTSRSPPTIDSPLDWVKFEEHEGSLFPTQSHDYEMLPSQPGSNSPSSLYRPFTTIETPISTPRSYSAALENGIFMPSDLDNSHICIRSQMTHDPVLIHYPSIPQSGYPLAHYHASQSINPNRLEDLRYYPTPASPYPSEGSQSYLDDHDSTHFDDHDSLNDPDCMQPKRPFTTKGENYATLLYHCLREAPDHQKELREIYQWFELYTDKATNVKDGWRNSVRHNLSMNDVSTLNMLFTPMRITDSYLGIRKRQKKP